MTERTPIEQAAFDAGYQIAELHREINDLKSKIRRLEDRLDLARSICAERGFSLDEEMGEAGK